MSWANYQWQIKKVIIYFPLLKWSFKGLPHIRIETLDIPLHAPCVALREKNDIYGARSETGRDAEGKPRHKFVLDSWDTSGFVRGKGSDLDKSKLSTLCVYRHPYFINPLHLSARVGVKMTIKNAEKGGGHSDWLKGTVRQLLQRWLLSPSCSSLLQIMMRTWLFGFKIGKASCRSLKISSLVATNTAGDCPRVTPFF